MRVSIVDEVKEAKENLMATINEMASPRNNFVLKVLYNVRTDTPRILRSTGDYIVSTSKSEDAWLLSKRKRKGDYVVEYTLSRKKLPELGVYVVFDEDTNEPYVEYDGDEDLYMIYKANERHEAEIAIEEEEYDNPELSLYLVGFAPSFEETEENEDEEYNNINIFNKFRADGVVEGNTFNYSLEGNINIKRHLIKLEMFIKKYFYTVKLYTPKITKEEGIVRTIIQLKKTHKQSIDDRIKIVQIELINEIDNNNYYEVSIELLY